MSNTTVTIVLTAASIIVNGLLWFGSWVLLQHNGTITPLHYTIYFGIDLTASSQYSAYAIPAVGLLMILSHLFFAALVDHPMWKRSWLLLSFVGQLLLGTALLVLLFVRQV